jgi:hypothetical protein
MEYSVDICQFHLIYGVIQFLIIFADFFCLDDWSIGDRGVLKSATTTVLGVYLCFFKYIFINISIIHRGFIVTIPVRIILYIIYIASIVSPPQSSPHPT